MFKKIVMLGAVLMLSACAIGNKYDYNAVAPQLETQTTKAVTVAVSDQRPYVLSGNKGPDFVGLQRGGFGNPFPVHTQSGNPLAADLGQAIAKSLSLKGVNATAAVVAPGSGPDAVNAASDRVLFVAMREWKTDVFAQTTFHWNVEASVLDSSGTVLAANTETGSSGIGTAVLEAGKSNIAISSASQKLQELLNTPEITSALQ